MSCIVCAWLLVHSCPGRASARHWTPTSKPYMISPGTRPTPPADAGRLSLCCDVGLLLDRGRVPVPRAFAR
eukprot:scaffold135150_cov31-Tisochrysis_lutea.AAC.2